MTIREWLLSLVPALMEGSTGTDLVSNLLTGGGFAFLAVIMGGIFLFGKNQSESAKTIAEGSAAWATAAVAAARTEVAEAKKDAADAKQNVVAARTELENLQDSIEVERRNFRRWIRQQKLANDQHKAWDDELVGKFTDLVQRLNQMAGQLRESGIADVKPFSVEIREAPPMAIYSLDDPEIRFFQ